MMPAPALFPLPSGKVAAVNAYSLPYMPSHVVLSGQLLHPDLQPVVYCGRNRQPHTTHLLAPRNPEGLAGLLDRLEWIAVNGDPLHEVT